MRLLTAFLIGLVFGTGIAVSGMINPAKVLNFFDIAGIWDPSLAFVMGGALITTFAGYRLILRRRGPMLAPAFQLPPARRIDARPRPRRRLRGRPGHAHRRHGPAGHRRAHRTERARGRSRGRGTARLLRRHQRP